MTLRSFLAHLMVVVTVGIWTTGAHSNDAQSIDNIRHQVLKHASEHYRQQYGQQAFEQNVELTVGQLDPRLRLARCDDYLTLKIKEPPHSPRNSTVKVSCDGNQRWTIYIPLTVDVYSEVLVASRSLRKGDVLNADDFSFKRLNISQIGHGLIEDIDRATGMELKRPLKSGETIRLSFLRQPDIVLKGQAVIVTSESRFMSVQTPGIALRNGHLGEFIKVKNERSKRIIDAKVVAPGMVSVALR